MGVFWKPGKSAIVKTVKTNPKQEKEKKNEVNTAIEKNVNHFLY